MRKKNLRLLSFTLAAALVLSSANTGGVVLASGVDESVVQQEIVSSENAGQSTEEISEEVTETEEQTTQQVTEEESTQEMTTEAVTESTTSEESEQTDSSEEETEEELVEEEIDKKEVADAELVFNLITDSALFQMVLDIYNTQTASNKTATTFTYADLSTFTGEMDFSSQANAAAVKSVKGLGSAKNAVSINMNAFTNVTEIEAKEFQNCKMTSVALPANLKKIGEQAFESCTALTEINAGTQKNTLPASLTEVGQQAFSSVSALKEIILPSFTAGGTILQNSTSLFANCSSLEKITIGRGIQTIPASAFTGAGKASADGVSLIFESNSALDKILGDAFANMKFTSDATLNLTNCGKLSSISDAAFRNAENLTTVILPSGLTSLQFGSNTFARTNLTAMYVSGSVKTEIYLPDYVTGIGAGCFYGNTDMTSISLSPNLTAIPDYTFDGCTALKTVTQRTASGQCKVKEIGDCAFRETAIENTDFLLNMKQLTIIGYQKLSVCGVGNTNKDKVLSPGLGGENVRVVSAVTHEKVVQQGSQSKPCGSEVFTNCTSLTSVSLPASVRQIGSRAFYFADKRYGQELSSAITSDSQITTVTWASSTEKNAERRIYPEAFYGNQMMTKMVLPENKGSGETLYIDEHAFCNCKSLETIGTSAGGNVFPVTLSGIGKGAFEFCASIPQVTICSTEAGTCPQLGEQAFQHCTSIASAVLPKETTEVPDHFFYNAPVATFSVGTGNAIERFGDLSFLGNQFTTLNLSKYTNLTEIGAGAFADRDSLVENDEWDKLSKLTGSGLATCNEQPTLTTVILPAQVTGESNTLHLNSGAFDAQLAFTTMKTPNAGIAGQIYIPDYIKESGYGVFAGTGVSKAIWQADTTGKNQWKMIPTHFYEFCTNIIKAEDVLPKGSYVERIGKRAFYASSIQSVDLSHYTSLKQIGSGTLTSNANMFPGTFESCVKLKSVKLPQSAFTIEEKTFYKDTALGSDNAVIDLGGATSIGKNGMAECDGMTQITFPASLVEVGENAFLGCDKLETVDFGSLQKIGRAGFKSCPELVLTSKGLPDSLLEIGDQAFMENGSLGTVSFGSNLKSIGVSSFEKSGMNKVDFSKAKNLEKIENLAFSDTKLTEFNISGTKVTQINTILQNSSLLTTASFGDEVLYIGKDALAGCPKFRSLTFASTATVNNQVFYTKHATYGTTAQQSLNPGTVSITVNTPDETTIPIGRTFYFPYYVNQKGKSSFDYILVGNESSPDTIDQYLKVTANLTDGYYKQRQSNDDGDRYKVTDPAYYQKVEPAPSMTVAATKQEIDTIQLEGLKPTEGTIDFRVVCSISFECQDKEVSINANKFSADYKLKVEMTPLVAELYKDNKREIHIPAGQATHIQAANSQKGVTQYYYDMVDAGGEYSTPDTYDIVVETSNPDVIYPGSSSSVKKQASYTTNVTRTDSTGKITGDAGRQNFYLIPSGIGTAVIKVYPKGYPQYAHTFTYTVNSDIQTIKLEIPKDYQNKINPGAAFSVFSEYKNYFGQTASVTDMSTFDKYSNQKIVFTSDNPEYVSVDQKGNVKILKADVNQKSVKITATAPTSVEGRVVTTSLTLNIKYPDTKPNENVVDSATGATVAVTKPSKKDLEGEAKFVKPQSNTGTTVTVPDTVTVNGVQYKVTSVSANAFKNNTKIKTVKIGKYVKEIGDNAFYGCKNMTKITLPASITKIGKKAFYNCKKLKTISIPSKAALTEIGDSAFYNCIVLTKITIPAKVTKIGTKAFYNCKKLKTITIKSTVLSSVGKNAFKNIHKKATIKVPKKKLAAYKTLLKGKGQKKTVKIKK